MAEVPPSAKAKEVVPTTRVRSLVAVVMLVPKPNVQSCPVLLDEEHGRRAR